MAGGIPTLLSALLREPSTSAILSSFNLTHKADKVSLGDQKLFDKYRQGDDDSSSFTSSSTIFGTDSFITTRNFLERAFWE